MSSKNTTYLYPNIVQVLVRCDSGGSVAPPVHELRLLLKSGRAWTGGTNKTRRDKAKQVIAWIKDLEKSPCMRIVEDALGKKQANWDRFYAELTPEKESKIQKAKMIKNPDLDHEWMELCNPPIRHPSWAKAEQELEAELKTEDEDFNLRAYEADKKLLEAGGQPQSARATRSSTRSVSPIASSAFPQKSPISKSIIAGHGSISGVRNDHSGRSPRSFLHNPTPSDNSSVSSVELTAFSEVYDQRDKANEQDKKELTKAENQVRQKRASLVQTQQDLLRLEEQLREFELALQRRETALQQREDRLNISAAKLRTWASGLKQWQHDEINAANEHAHRLEELRQWVLNEKRGSGDGMDGFTEHKVAPPPAYPQ